MTHVRCESKPDGIEIQGTHGNSLVQLTVAPRYGYLTTRLVESSHGYRHGFSITKLVQFGKAWMPRSVEVFDGTYNQGRLTQGESGSIEFADISQHGPPTEEEAPSIPAGSVLGSEDSRLYRMPPDGTLVDFGRQGYKPGNTLAWGDLFVLSGAGLLLGSLSWLVFRKRRTPSPLRDGPPRGGAQR